MHRAIFFDRDGVLNRATKYPEWGLDSPARPQDLHLYQDAARAVRKVRSWGFLAVLISNQPGVAKGKYPLETFWEIDDVLNARLRQAGARLDARYYCLHHPEARVQQYRQECECRKPKPGLLLKAAADWGISLETSYFIGDSWTDVQAANAAGCVPVLIARGASEQEDVLGGRVSITSRDLGRAIDFIGGREGRHVA